MAVDYEVRIYRGWKFSYEQLTSIFTIDQINELKDNDYLYSMDSWQSDENADWVLGVSVFHTPLGTAKELDVEPIYKNYNKEEKMIAFVSNMIENKEKFKTPNYVLAHQVW